MSRDLARLPKAHLHLHLTGGMRRSTLQELAAEHGVRLPRGLLDGQPVRPEPGRHGWFRFQRLYDAARSVLRREDDVRRLVREIAEDEAAAGSGWLELQVDPTGYAPRFGGLVPALELVLDATAAAARDTGVGIGVVVAANRTRHPLAASTLARLAARYAGRGVVGFGLSNDERAGPAEQFAQAFRIARSAGLLAVPHGGELLGAHSVRACVEQLGAHRVGHGVRAVEEPGVLELLARRGVALEVCPASNVALGVVQEPEHVPLRVLRSAGVRVSLSSDDPLLFGAGLLDNYAIAARLGCDDGELAAVAADSVHASAAPSDLRARMLAGIDGWLGG